MHQRALDFTPEAKRVRETSLEAHRTLTRTHALEARAAEVLGWLEAYERRRGVAPTSGELADHVWKAGAKPRMDWTAFLLHIRRGLSDLQDLRRVEAVPKGRRRCAVGGRTCETWRTTP